MDEALAPSGVAGLLCHRPRMPSSLNYSEAVGKPSGGARLGGSRWAPLANQGRRDALQKYIAPQQARQEEWQQGTQESEGLQGIVDSLPGSFDLLAIAVPSL